jgi:hypothetical protein
MANAPGGNKIGEAYVELRARMDKLEMDLAAARAASAKTADQMGSDAKRSADSFTRGSDQIELSLKKQSSLFTSLLSRVTAVVAAMVSFHTIGTKIRELFITSGEDRAESFMNSIASDDMATRLKKVTDEIDTLKARATAARTTFLGFWGNVILDRQTAVGIDREIAPLLKRQESLRKAMAIQGSDARKKLRADEHQQEVTQSVAAQEEIRKAILGHVQDISDADADASTRAREQRIEDAAAWTAAEKQAVDELREHERDSMEKSRAAQNAIDESIRRNHENFRRSLFERNSVDIRRIEHMLRRMDLNRSR